VKDKGDAVTMGADIRTAEVINGQQTYERMVLTMRTKNSILALFLVLIFGVIVGHASAVARAADKIVWKRADFSAPSSRAVQMCDWFFQEVTKRSGGRFVDEPYYSATLSPADKQPDALKSGLIQTTTWLTSYYPTKGPLWNIALLPCLFPLMEENKDHYVALFAIMNEWMATPLLMEELAKWDAMPLGNIQAIHYALMGKDRITTLADLEGKKIRAVGGSADVLKAAGAVPISIAVTEMYDAMSKGIVQNICWSWRGFWPYKLYEVSKYHISNINLGHIPFALLAKKSAFDALPQDIKKIFQDVMKEFPDYVCDQSLIDFHKAIEVFKNAGIEELRFQDNQKLVDLSVGIWKAYVEKQGAPGKEAFNSLQTIMQKHIPGYKPYKL
jgi:TRAP-type transport system periplasmic protein